MEERAIALAAKGPVTVQSLGKDLRGLGVRPGMVLIVHSSLSAMGWVCGGAVSVILALQSVLRSYGTLIMPTHSGDLSDPSMALADPQPLPVSAEVLSRPGRSRIKCRPRRPGTCEGYQSNR